jgi:hypothetical protein
MQGRDVGSWWHLVKRFFEVATARPLDEVERATVESWIRNRGEAELFWAQAVADQRHAFRAARRLQDLTPSRADLIRAALLHDVGKRHAGLGILRRSLAGALTKLRLPVRGSFATYVAHGALAADELTTFHAEKIVIEFARHHHDGRPSSISRDDWSLLEQADGQGKAPGTRRSAIR